MYVFTECQTLLRHVNNITREYKIMLRTLNYFVICQAVLGAKIGTESADVERIIAKWMTLTLNSMSQIMQPSADYSFRNVGNDKGYKFHNSIITSCKDETEIDYHVIANFVFCLYQRAVKLIYMPTESGSNNTYITDSDVKLLEEIKQERVTDQELTVIISHIKSTVKALSNLSNSIQVALYRGEQESDVFELDGGTETTRVDGLFDEPNHVQRLKCVKVDFIIKRNKAGELDLIPYSNNSRLHLSYPSLGTFDDVDEILNKMLLLQVYMDIDVNPNGDGCMEVHAVRELSE